MLFNMQKSDSPRAASDVGAITTINRPKNKNIIIIEQFHTDIKTSKIQWYRYRCRWCWRCKEGRINSLKNIKGNIRRCFIRYTSLIVKINWLAKRFIVSWDIDWY